MNQIHDLDADTEDYFEFILGGNNYRMRFPTTEEIEEADKLKTEQEKNDFIYGYINPVADGPPIKEVLRKINIKKAAKFSEMVRKEFGA